MKEAARVVFTKDVCPHGHVALSLEYPGGGGTRLTGLKCCGRWDEVERFVVDGEDVIEGIQSVMDENLRQRRYDPSR